MIVFFILLLFIVIVCLIPTKDKKSRKVKLFVSLLGLFIIMAFRVDWAPDYVPYMELFDQSKYLSFKDIISSKAGVETGYLILQYLLPSYRCLLVTVSLWFCICLFVFIIKFIPDKYWFFAFILMFLDSNAILGNISGIRTSIAVGFLLLAIISLARGRKLYYIVLLLAASLFHTSALLFLPLFIFSRKQSISKITKPFVFFILLAIASTIIPQSFVNTVEFLLNNLDSIQKYYIYIENMGELGFRGLSFIFIFFWLYILLKELRKPGHTEFEYTIMRFSLLWFVFTLAPAVGMSSRFYFYLDFIFIAAIIIVIKNLDDIPIKILTTFSLLVYYGMDIIPRLSSPHYQLYWLNYHFSL